MATLNNVITNANGCVGIGTSSPAQLLELKKTTGSAIALLNYNDSVKFNINASSAGAGYVGMVTNHDLIFVTNDTERARLNTNGNLGIGTSSPAYKLEVLGLVNVVSAPGSYGAMFRARDSVTLGTESFGGVHFTSNPGTDYTIGKWTTAAGAGLLQIRDQSGNKFFTIDGAGNVGIGTTTLSSLLTLHGTYPQLVANNPSTGSGVVIQLRDNGRDAGFMGHSTTTARLQFGSRGSSAAHMTISGDGDVGIGTTAPTNQANYRFLQVNGTNSAVIETMVGGSRIGGFDSTASALYVGTIGSYPIVFRTAVNEKMRIASDGKVGIGTSSPNHILDIAGGTGTTFNMGNSSDSLRGGKLSIISGSATGRQFYVGTTSAIYNLVFGIDSVEKARIDTSGNLGINTTSPSAKLHVSASASTTAGIFQGVVGIGLTPTSAVPRLQIYGTSTSNAESRLAIYTSNTGTAYNNGLQLAVASDSVTSLINYSNTDLYFGTNSTERMRITSVGNVGIGTTTPGAKLQVSSSASTLAASFRGNVGVGNLSSYYYGLCSLTKQTSGLNLNIMYASLSSGYGEILMSNYNDNTGASGWASFIRSYSNPSSDYSSFLTFGTSPSSLGGPSERMRITAAGYVGIGTSNTTPYSSLFPGQLVIDSGTSDVDGIFATTNNANAAELILVKKNTTNNYGSLLIKHAGTSGDAIEVDYGINTSTGEGGTNSFKVTTGGDGYFKGSVGIGTTSPVSRFQISQTAASYPMAKFTDNVFGPGAYLSAFTTVGGNVLGFAGVEYNLSNTTNRRLWIGTHSPLGTTETFVGTPDNLPLSFYTTGSLRMSITAGGSVGIGTSSPTQTLQVNGDQLIYANVAGAANSNKLIFGSFANTAAGAIYAQTTTGTTGDLVLAAVLSSTITEYVRIKSTGNVGIGTNNPATKLEVFGGALSSTSGSLVNISTFSSTTSNGSYLKILERRYKTGTDWQTSTTRIQKTVDVTNQAYIDFNPSGSLYGLAFGTGAATESMRITSNGAVGIGTTTPISKLHVEGPQITLNTEGSYTEKILYFRYSNGARIMSDSYLTFYTTGTPTEKMRIDANGNVGIGTTVMRSKLEIAGNTSSPPIASVQWTPTARSGSFGIDGTGVYIRNSSNGDYFDLKNASGVARFRVIYDNATHLNTTFVSIGNLSQTGSKLSVFGNTSIGSSYGSTAAPSNGLIVQGSVGIGTTAPSGSLTIQTNGTQLRLQTASGPSAYYSTINSLYDSTHPFSIAVAGNSLTTAEYFGIYADSGGSNPRIALLNGNVGIGTTTPFGTAANRTVLSVNGTTDVSLNIGSGGSQRAYLYGVSTYAELGTIGSLPLTFAPNNSEKMRLNVDGNVGIGTTSPSQKLELNGTSTAIRILSTTGDAYVRLTDNGVRNWDLKVVDVNDYFEVGGTNTTSLVVTGAGNVGIGTTAPAYKLEVNGSLYATRLSGSAMFTTNGKGRFYGTASYALASAGGGSSLTGQTDSVTPFETSLGHQAGNSNTGTGNTAIGYQALFSNTTGTGSIAIGYQALYSNTRGKRNIAIGYEALRTTQGSTDGFGDPIGDENVAIGYQAARAAFNINRVVAIGHRALAKNLAGGNVAIGWLAMESNVGTANSNLGILNTAVGTMALSSNTSGNANSAFGYLALNANTTGNENTAVGHRSMLYNTTGKNNCSFGSYALYYNQIANNNSAFGAFALYSNTTNNNSAFGYKALRYNTTGVNNDAFGYQALYSNISGKGNSAFGFQALKYTTTATGNSAFGRSALTQCSGGGRNSAFGYYSSGAITGNPAFGGSGMDNCSFGYRSLRFNNSGNNNTAVGKDALYNNKVSNQTAIGYNALLGSTTGNGGNTAVGSNAGSAITFGYRNTMIGNNAGATGAAPLTTGQNNTCLGNGAITSTATVSNEITLGNSSITTLRCQVTTITSLSDIRDKDDIIPVDVGLSFIEKLRPVTFKWDKREWYTDGNRDGSKKDTITQIGFIAQELKALQESENATYLNLVYESNPDKLEATPGNLMIPLIKAVQELNAIVKQQRVEFDDKIAKQQLEIDYLKSKLNN